MTFARMPRSLPRKRNPTYVAMAAATPHSDGTSRRARTMRVTKLRALEATNEAGDHRTPPRTEPAQELTGVLRASEDARQTAGRRGLLARRVRSNSDAPYVQGVPCVPGGVAAVTAEGDPDAGSSEGLLRRLVERRPEPVGIGEDPHRRAELGLEATGAPANLGGLLVRAQLRHDGMAVGVAAD